MHKSKKKSSNADKLPKPIKVKKEKTEEDRSLHPMAHFVDDRLELVKQIFGTLKPKTITNLAPEFLKKKSMVEVEELCLNELMCISTKRLLSIINATKCPTDTESDEDSDVEHQEEHISLEEISSDSEFEGNTAKNKGSRRTKKDNTSSENQSANGGQISVLELLELQARARAIRSQLALEPVTKIEVDSGDEQMQYGATDKPPNRLTGKAPKEPSDRRNHKRKSSDHNKVSSSAMVVKSKSSAASESPQSERGTGKQQSNKKVKLKRNYRNSNAMMSVADNGSAEDPSKSSTEADMKREHQSRSASPDCIPIVAEPETLLISDSDSNDEFLVNGKNGVTVSDTASAEAAVAHRVRAISEETEEGEITESETEKDSIECVESTLNGKETVEPGSDETAPKLDTEVTSTPQVVQSEADTVDTTMEMEPTVGSSVQQVDAEAVAAEHVVVSAVQESSSNDNAKAPEDIAIFPDDDDQNDDVISIGGDLESEMIEHLEEDSSSKTSFAATSSKLDEDSKSRQDDVISLESSADEAPKQKPDNSWHGRYLQSSKVNKVLATSRLGKRVRDKIKKTKRSKKDEAAESAVADSQKPKEVFNSKHEDGSIEQYKELLQLRQRKS